MTSYAFDFAAAPAGRSIGKPRQRGLTGLLDYGIGLARTRDLLDVAAHVIDFAKFATATARVYAPDRLQAKLALYREYGVRPFMGGQFPEYMYATAGNDGVARLFAEAKRIGFDMVEVSDTCAPLTLDERRRLVEIGKGEGLTVICEIGQLVSSGDIDCLIRDAEDCIELGAAYVMVEGAEMVDRRGPRIELIQRVKQALDVDRLIFELPGPGVGDATAGAIEAMKQMLVRDFGPDVNLSNIPADEVIETEVVRLGIEDPTNWARR